MCLSIVTHKTINFPFVPNGKLMVFRYPNILSTSGLSICKIIGIKLTGILSHVCTVYIQINQGIGFS